VRLVLVSLSKMPRGFFPGHQQSCPEAFPIKASDYTAKWKVPTGNQWTLVRFFPEQIKGSTALLL